MRDESNIFVVIACSAVIIIMFLVLLALLSAFFGEIEKIAKGDFIAFGIAIIYFVLLCLLAVNIWWIASKTIQVVTSKNHWGIS